VDYQPQDPSKEYQARGMTLITITIPDTRKGGPVALRNGDLVSHLQPTAIIVWRSDCRRLSRGHKSRSEVLRPYWAIPVQLTLLGIAVLEIYISSVLPKTVFSSLGLLLMMPVHIPNIHTSTRRASAFQAPHQAPILATTTKCIYLAPSPLGASSIVSFTRPPSRDYNLLTLKRSILQHLCHDLLQPHGGFYLLYSILGPESAIR
jgi:hypothetical protein